MGRLAEEQAQLRQLRCRMIVFGTVFAVVLARLAIAVVQRRPVTVDRFRDARLPEQVDWSMGDVVSPEFVQHAWATHDAAHRAGDCGCKGGCVSPPRPQRRGDLVEWLDPLR
jgi:hypothetical protein